MNLSVVTSKKQSIIAFRQSFGLTVRSIVCILEKNAVSVSTELYAAYISINKHINGRFRRSTWYAAIIVATPKTSINGESNSYKRKYIYDIH